MDICNYQFSFQYSDNDCFETIYPAYKVDTDMESSNIISSFFTRVNNVSVQCLLVDENFQEQALVEAKMVVPSKATTSTGSYDYTEQDLIGFSQQPMITYCQIMKPDDGSSLGITFERGTDSKIRIGCIDPDSPFARPMCLNPGDEVIAINGLALATFSSNEMIDLYATNNTSSSNNVSITVWNAKGEPNAFMNSVQVPTIDCKLGIILQNELYNGRLLIDRIAVDGMFGSSLLGAEHQVVTINNIPCSYLHCRDAVDLLHCTNATTTTTSNDGNVRYHHKNVLSRIPSGCNKNAAIVISQEIITNDPPQCPNLFRRRFGYMFHKTDTIFTWFKN